jgi:hypothetical protein
MEKIYGGKIINVIDRTSLEKSFLEGKVALLPRCRGIAANLPKDLPQRRYYGALRHLILTKLAPWKRNQGDGPGSRFF